MSYLQLLYILAALITILGIPVYISKYLKKKSEKKNKKMEIRKIILKELDMNYSIIKETKNWVVDTIEVLKKPLEKHLEYITPVPKFKSSIKDFPKTIVYENITSDLKMLGGEEIRAIMHAYKHLREIKRDWEDYPKKFNAPEKSNKDIIKELEPINGSITYTLHFIGNLKKKLKIYLKDRNLE